MTLAFRPQSTRTVIAAPAQDPSQTALQIAPPQHDARDLIGHGQTATITLDGMVYTLRITRAGKLILTK